MSAKNVKAMMLHGQESIPTVKATQHTLMTTGTKDEICLYGGM